MCGQRRTLCTAGLELRMENIMSKWSRKFGKILTAAGISAFIAVSSLAVPMEASAARAVTDDIMIRNDASREAGAIGSLQEGEEVTILDAVQSADGYVWYYIQLENGNTGYVRSDLIEASDEELAAINSGQPENEQTQEAEPEEEAEEPEQEPQEEPAGQDQSTQEAAAAAATQAPPAQTPDGEYDATKDPNAKFSVSYDTDESGNGEWYVHNEDNGSKWKVSDIQGQGGTAAQTGGVAGIWRTLAILFGIIAVALAAFVLFLLKSIRDGRSKTTRGRALEAAASGYDDDGDDSDDEYYFDDDEEVSEDEDSEDEDSADEKTSESEEAVEQKDRADLSENVSDKKPVKTPDSTITMDVSSEPEITEIPTEEIEAAIAATTAQYEKKISDEGEKADTAPVQAAEEEKSDLNPPLKPVSTGTDDDSEPEGSEEEAEQEEEVLEEEISEEEDYSDEDYEDEDYEDEDYEDEDSDEYEDSDDDYEDDGYEDEDYEDDELEEEEADDAKGSRSRSSSKGGFFGFLKKMFGTDSSEDAEDEGEDFDDYDDEPEEHEFDEFKEYPEDIDLLPREDEPEEEEDPDDEDGDYSDQGADTAGSERGRLSMQRVMKNVSYKEEEADFSDGDDLSDSLFEDDDDMEYSFISNTRNKK